MGNRERRALESREATADFQSYFRFLPLDDVIEALEVTKTTVALGWLKPEADIHLGLELYKIGTIPGTDCLMTAVNQAAILQRFYRTRLEQCDAVIERWNKEATRGKN